MGFFSRLFGGRSKEPDQLPLLNIEGPGMFEFDVVGESHYQTALDDICGGPSEDGHSLLVDAYLVHEDDNEYDPKAVVVMIGSQTVGYLSRKLAREFRKVVAETGHPGVAATCKAKIVGGWDRGGGDQGSYGVKLDLPLGD